MVGFVRPYLVLAVGLLAGAWTTQLRAAEPAPPDLQGLLERLDDLYRSEASISRIELAVTTPRQERTMRMKAWTRGTDRALFVIEAPAREKGTTTLRVGDNLWNYLPRISRTIRVPPSMMLSSWMGTDLTNDDLVRSSSYHEDFDAKIVRRVEKPAGWLIQLDAKQGRVGLWKRIDMVITDGLLPHEARYYDRRLRHARTIVFDAVRAFGKRKIPSRMLVQPLDKKGHETVVRYLDVEFDADVPESTFSLSRLETKRR